MKLDLCAAVKCCFLVLCPACSSKWVHNMKINICEVFSKRSIVNKLNKNTSMWLSWLITPCRKQPFFIWHQIKLLNLKNGLAQVWHGAIICKRDVEVLEKVSCHILCWRIKVLSPLWHVAPWLAMSSALISSSNHSRGGQTFPVKPLHWRF